MKPLRGTAGAALALALMLPGSAVAETRGHGGGWFEVQIPGPITQVDRDRIVAAGGEHLMFWPPSSYLAWSADGDLDQRVRARTLRPDVKIDRSARQASRLVALQPADESLLPLAAATRLLAVDPADSSGDLVQVTLAPGPGVVDRVASIGSVLYVGPAATGMFAEDEASAQIVAGNVGGFPTRPWPGYRDWLAEHGLDGSGVTATIVDTGLDETHPDLKSRVTGKFWYGPVAEPWDLGGHGTHVAGIVAGDGTNDLAFGVEDEDGFRYGLGVAPGAELIGQAAIPITPTSYQYPDISRDAVRAGANVWNASWHSGEGTGVGYIANARTMDMLVRDADWDSLGAEALTMVFSAGNAGSGLRTMTAPKEAKNLITVGNSHSHRSGSIHAIANTSSRGPAVDGRILPTVVAPGSSIISTRGAPAGSSCGVPATGTIFYSSCSGTSMAAPHVTGAAALITQWWRNGNEGSTPSPAMIKGLLVNTAVDLALPDVPSPHEGWGRVDLGAVLDPSVSRIYVDGDEVLSDPGSGFSLDVTPVDPERPMKVTLVWTDAPGAPGANPALVNDLDLRVSDGENIYLGNSFDRGMSIVGGQRDSLNNLENVYLKDPSGTYTVTIEAVALPGDGVPFLGDETDQDFALVVSNATLA